MQTWFARTEKKIERALIWLGGYSALTGLFAWISKQLQSFQSYGWAEAIVSGFLLASVGIVSIAIGLAAWRFFNPLAQPSLPDAATRESTNGQYGGKTPELPLSQMRREIGEAEARLKAADASNLELHKGLAKNLEDATVSQLSRMRTDVENISAKDRAAQTDLLHLLDWATYRATEGVIQSILKEQPRATALNPPDDDKLRMEIIQDCHAWVSRVQSLTTTVAYGQELSERVFSALRNADMAFRQIPPEDRPANIDVLKLQDFFIAVKRCEGIGEYLEYVIREVQRAQFGQINTLRERLRLRQKH